MGETSVTSWLDSRHSLLWEAFENRDFSMQEAVRVLQDEKGDDEKTVSAVLSELRRAGYLVAELDTADARRRRYRLRSKADILREALTTNKNQLTRSDIETILKKAADLIRTRVDYKFILILLFLKRISDKWELECDQAYKEALEDGLSDKQAREEAKSAAYHDFDIPEEFLWEKIRQDVTTLPEKFSRALKVLAEKNPEVKDILDNVDFVQFTTSRENAEILRQLVELFSEQKLHHVSPDVLGDAYEWILRYFAPQKAKEGEVYTPREVIQLLVELLSPKPGEHIYDPACGSGGMLIASHKYVENNFGKEEARKLFLYGQEANQGTLTLARMNMYIHDIRDMNLTFGDTLLYPKFKEGDGVQQFEVVVANPPWNQDGYDEQVLKKGEFWRKRYPYGFVPRKSADWAWIQHMLASARPDTGRVGIVIDNSCLFRGGKEQAIRKEVLEKDDPLEAVILLPEKLFYNTGAPGAIVVFNKDKPRAHWQKVLIINATNEFERHPEIKKLNRLSEANIHKIHKAYADFKDVPGFARTVSIEEIRANDYNLSVPRYVEPAEAEEEIDIARTWLDIQTLEAERASSMSRIETYLKELGFDGEAERLKTKSLEEIKRILREHLPSLRKEYGVRYLGLFGSYVRGEPAEGSDLDLLVEFEDRPLSLLDIIGLENYLSDLLGIKVDLVEKKGLKPRIGDRILAEVIEI
ncbi:MAG: N-6 DNA methylase [Candidatus Binatia bacterium]